MNTRRAILLMLATTAGAFLAPPAPSQAAIYYPWCAVYSGSETGGGTNCYFSTHQQCMETVRGIGGVCEPNGFYYAARASERAEPVSKRRRRD